MQTPSTDVLDRTAEQLRAEIRAARESARSALADKLHDCDAPELAARLERCGQPLGLTCTNCGHRKMAFTRCDLKWCPSCAPLLAHRAVTRYAPICAEFLSPLFVTFTVKNFADRVGMRDVRRAFTKLRRLRWWKRCVAGGVAQVEVTNTGNGWHPHVHALIDCRWLAVTVPRPAPGTSTANFKHAARRALTEVADQWTLALARKGSVKVRAVFRRDDGDPTAACREVIKYSVKPADLIAMPDPTPLIRELALTRNLVSWGTAYRHPSLKKRTPKACPCEQCNECGTFMPDEIVDAIVRASRK